MRGWFLTIALLLCLDLCDASAQAERNYLQAGATYVLASGRLPDSADFHSSTAYSIGYQWSPSRSVSFGMVGTYLPASVTSGSAASVFGMSALTNYRLIKHGFTPYVGAEVGFSYLTVADSLASNAAMKPNLSYAVSVSAGLLIPLSDRVEVDVAGRYCHTGIGGGLALIGGALGLRYRLQ